jgi:hypothetical protein
MTCGRRSLFDFLASCARILSTVIVAMSLLAAHAQAQVSAFGRTSAPTAGGTAGLPPPAANPFATNQGNFAQAHKTADGKPCIVINPRVVPQISNPRIFNHVVLVGNICGKSLKIRVCYFRSSSCIIVAVKGYEKIEQTLGISPGVADFRYEYRELL